MMKDVQKHTDLMGLDDDTLHHVVLSIENVFEDIIFIALACKRLCACVRRILESFETMARHQYPFLPSNDGSVPMRLRTDVKGTFSSEARISFFMNTWHEQEGRLFPGSLITAPGSGPDLTGHDVPISVLFRMVEVAPWGYLHEIFFERRCSWDQSWDIFYKKAPRALVTFAAMHGRCDVLDALYSMDSQPLQRLFEPRIIDEMFACGYCTTNYHHRNWNREWREVIMMLVRPAIIGGHWNVIEWVVRVTQSKRQRRRLPMTISQHCWFGPLRFQLSSHMPTFKGSVGTLQVLLKDAARAGNVRIFQDAFDRIIALWSHSVLSSIDERGWILQFCYMLLHRAFGSRSCIGTFVKEITKFCRANTLMLRCMFTVPFDSGEMRPFDLEDLIEGGQHMREYVDPNSEWEYHNLREAVFTPGDQEYNEWLLQEAGLDSSLLGADGCSAAPGFLSRSVAHIITGVPWMASLRRVPIEDRTVTSTICRILIRSQLQPGGYVRRHHERRAPAFGGRDQRWGEFFAHGSDPFLDVNLQIFDRSPLARIPGTYIRDTRHHQVLEMPNALERGKAFLVMRWVENEMEGGPEPFIDEEWSVPWTDFTSMAMLPVVMTLSDRYTQRGWSYHLALLGKVVLDAMKRLFDELVLRVAEDEQVANSLVAHINLGYRRNHFSRDQFEAVVATLKLRGACEKVFAPRRRLVHEMRGCFDVADAEV